MPKRSPDMKHKLQRRQIVGLVAGIAIVISAGSIVHSLRDYRRRTLTYGYRVGIPEGGLGQPWWAGSDERALQELMSQVQASFEARPASGECPVEMPKKFRLHASDLRLGGRRALVFRRDHNVLILTFIDEAGRVACTLLGSM
jgi:hypothetical protein